MSARILWAGTGLTELDSTKRMKCGCGPTSCPGDERPRLGISDCPAGCQGKTTLNYCASLKDTRLFHVGNDLLAGALPVRHQGLFPCHHAHRISALQFDEHPGHIPMTGVAEFLVRPATAMEVVSYEPDEYVHRVQGI